jgi:hypoxanthine phosphoribosyltransferase|tara:strand:- start:6971 stop:7414 length:444 start_codon:yes stop_codon:yes gene_type:complete
MDNTNVSFDEIRFYARTIADRLKEVEITHVIGLARGGLFPATIMSYMLDKPLIVTGISSYKDNKKTKSLSTYQPLNIATLKENNAHVLVVDDICDSGETIKYITNNLTLGGVKHKTACIFTKEKHKELLDHYGIVISDNMWIVFPWE